MKIFQRILFLILTMMVNVSLWAMDDPQENIQEYFPDFMTIKKEFLCELGKCAPRNPKHCGQAHKWYVIRWDHWSSNCKDLDSPFDDIKINPAPQSIALSINEATFSYEAQVKSSETLDEKRLVALVSENLKKGKPVMAYYQNRVSILLTTIVGFNPNTSELLLINNAGRGKERFISMDSSDFVMMMNLSPIFLMVGRHNIERFADLRPLFDDKDLWLPFTFIIFEKKSEKKLDNFAALENVAEVTITPPKNIFEKQEGAKEHSFIKLSSDKIKKKPSGWFPSTSSCSVQ